METKKKAKWKAALHPPLFPAKAGRKWKRYHVVWPYKKNHKKITQECNTSFGEQMLSPYEMFLWNDSIVLLLTTCANRKFQI